MTSKSLRCATVVAMALVIAGCGSSSSSSSGNQANAALQACIKIGMHSSSGAVGACQQGYSGNTAGKTLHNSCLFGSGAVTTMENINDCRIGYISAGGGGSQPTGAPTVGAASTCGGIAHGSTAGGIAACEQG